MPRKKIDKDVINAIEEMIGIKKTNKEIKTAVKIHYEIDVSYQKITSIRKAIDKIKTIEKDVENIISCENETYKKAKNILLEKLSYIEEGIKAGEISASDIDIDVEKLQEIATKSLKELREYDSRTKEGKGSLELIIEKLDRILTDKPIDPI